MFPFVTFSISDHYLTILIGLGKGLDNDFPLSYRVCRVVVRPQVPHDRIFVMHSTEYKCAGEPALVALF